jgi:hypothetical protein
MGGFPSTEGAAGLSWARSAVTMTTAAIPTPAKTYFFMDLGTSRLISILDRPTG